MTLSEPLSVVVDSNDCFWAHSTMSVSGFATGRPKNVRVHDVTDQNSLILPFAAIFEFR